MDAEKRRGRVSTQKAAEGQQEVGNVGKTLHFLELLESVTGQSEFLITYTEHARTKQLSGWKTRT